MKNKREAFPESLSFILKRLLFGGGGGGRERRWQVREREQAEEPRK